MRNIKRGELCSPYYYTIILSKKCKFAQLSNRIFPKGLTEIINVSPVDYWTPAGTDETCNVFVVHVLSELCTGDHMSQGGHKPGKPRILKDFSDHGKLMEFSTTSGKTDFVLWMQPVSSNPHAAKCIWCMKTVDLSNTGRQALVSHMSSSWCGMTLDIWRSSLRIFFVAITSGKV